MKYGDTLLKIAYRNGNYLAKVSHGEHTGEEFFLLHSSSSRMLARQFHSSVQEAGDGGYLWADQCFLSQDRTTITPNWMTLIKRSGCQETRVVQSLCSIDLFIPATGMITTSDDLFRAKAAQAKIEIYVKAFRKDTLKAHHETNEIADVLESLCLKSTSISWTPTLIVMNASGSVTTIRAARNEGGYDIPLSRKNVIDSKELQGEGPYVVMQGGALRMSGLSTDAYLKRLLSSLGQKKQGVIDHFLKTTHSSEGMGKFGPGVIVSKMRKSQNGAYEFATGFHYTGEWLEPKVLMGGSIGS